MVGSHPGEARRRRGGDCSSGRKSLAGNGVRHQAPMPPRGVGAVIRAFVVAGIRLYREGLATLLDAEPDMQAVGSTAEWADAVVPIRIVEPDVVLLDAVAEARTAVTALREAIPEARVVALSIGDSEADIL